MSKKAVYIKEYKMRLVGDGGVEVTIPKIVVERAARKARMNFEEFVETHRVQHLFNDFERFDAAYRFVPVQKMEIEEPDIEA